MSSALMHNREGMHPPDKVTLWDNVTLEDVSDLESESCKVICLLHPKAKRPYCSVNGNGLNIAAQKCGRVACKSNPNCLNHLGIEAWRKLDAFETYLDNQGLFIMEGGDQDLAKDTPVGLQNLGGTCYVNALLQVWFYTPIFREAVYDFIPNTGDPQIDQFCIELQRIFAHLESRSGPKVYNPVAFINALNLSHIDQQDAQEFCKLFCSKIELAFSTQKREHVRGLIANHYTGRYSYQTTCSVCGNVSEKACAFNELELSTHRRAKTKLEECIVSFIAPEPLVDQNQYFCGSCRQKVDATRYISLRSLPDILSFQLLRFVYNPAKQQRKKVTSAIDFPAELDMSFAMGQPPGSTEYVYELHAALLHKGPSAERGHYIAVVKDPSTNQWMDLNDEATKILPQPHFQFGRKRAKASASAINDRYSSNSAYMLMYTRKSIVMPLPVIPPHIEVDLGISKLDLEAKKTAYRLRKQTLTDEFNQRAHFFLPFLETAAPSQDDQPCYYVYRKALKSWIMQDVLLQSKIKGFTRFTEIDNTPLLCPHHKISPYLIHTAKRITKTGFDMLQAVVPISPQLTSNDFCLVCIQAEVERIAYQPRHESHIGRFKELNVMSVHSPRENVLISSAWLDDWLKVDPCRVEKVDGTYVSPMQDEFLYHVICREHRKRLPLNHPSCRNIQVTSEAYEYLRSFFRDKLPQLTANEVECVRCIDQIKEKEAAKKLKQKFPRIFSGRLLEDYHDGETIFVVPSDFIRRLTAYGSDPDSNPHPGIMDNSAFLCRHGAFCYKLHLEWESNLFYALSGTEWEKLCECYENKEIVNMNSNSVLVGRETCEPCFVERRLNFGIETPSITVRLHSELNARFYYSTVEDADWIPPASFRTSFAPNKTIFTLLHEISVNLKASPCDILLCLNDQPIQTKSSKSTMSDLGIQASDELELHLQKNCCSIQSEVWESVEMFGYERQKEYGFSGTGLSRPSIAATSPDAYNFGGSSHSSLKGTGRHFVDSHERPDMSKRPRLDLETRAPRASGSSASPSSPAPRESPAPETWSCSYCTFINTLDPADPTSSIQCSVCERRRSDTSQTGTLSGDREFLCAPCATFHKMGQPDKMCSPCLVICFEHEPVWHCKRCKSQNSLHKMVCRTCGALL